MPERAEIEAVARAFLITVAEHPPEVMDADGSWRLGGGALRAWEAAIVDLRVALNRVRDARGDDEAALREPACVREYHAMLAGDVAFLRAQRAKAKADIEAARCPQGEDREATVAAIEALLTSETPLRAAAHVMYEAPPEVDVARVWDAALSALDYYRSAEGLCCSSTEEKRRFGTGQSYSMARGADPSSSPSGASGSAPSPPDGFAAADERSPQGEDHEAGIETAACHAHMERVGRNLTSNEVMAVLTGVRTALSRVSPSRDGTVAVEDWRTIAVQLAALLRELHPQNPYYREKQAEALAAFDALAGESNEGGNQ
jgi:hypothetical protein